MRSSDALASPADSVVAENIMAALARFRVLTVRQLLDVTGRDEKTLRTRLNQLVTASLVKFRDFRLGEMGGRLPNIYWLTPKGARWVASATGQAVKSTDGKNLSITQAPHRVLILDCMIAADRWAQATGQGLPSFKTCLEGEPTRLDLVSKTAIADGIIEVTDTKENKRVYVVEVYCDYLDNASTKPYEKLQPYVMAAYTDALDTTLDIPESGKAALVLVICDTAKMRDRLVQRLPGRAGMPPLDKRVWQRFLFKSAESLADFGEGWQRVDGSVARLPS